MNVQDKNNLSGHLTCQHLKDLTQDLKQEQFDDTGRLHLATIKPLYWDYLRIFYYVVLYYQKQSKAIF